MSSSFPLVQPSHAILVPDPVGNNADSNAGSLLNNAQGQSIWPWLLLCAVVAVAIDFGTIHREQQGDSLIHVLTSLYCWTPFFWEENRFGMLVPLLAMPIKHPLANLLFQDAILIFSALSMFFLLPRYIFRIWTWPLIGTLSAAAFLVLAPEGYRFWVFIDQCYGLSLALGLAGLLLCERSNTPSRPGDAQRNRWSLLGAVTLLGLAHWINVGVSLVLGPLVMLRFLCYQEPLRFSPSSLYTSISGGTNRTGALELRHSLLAVVVGFMVGFTGMRMSSFQEHSTTLEAVPVFDWPGAWSQFAVSIWEGQTPHSWPIFLLVTCELGIAAGAFAPADRQTSSLWRGGAVLLFVALFYGLFAGTREWVHRSGFAHRYGIPPLLLLQTALIGFATLPIALVFRGRFFTRFPFLALVLLGSALYCYGFPSLSGVRADLDARAGKRTTDVLKGQCTHVAGNYWEVWPTVFHANLTLYEQGDATVIWGVCYRSFPSAEVARRVPLGKMRVAIPVDDEEAEGFLRKYQFPILVEVEKRSTITIWSPKQ